VAYLAEGRQSIQLRHLTVFLIAALGLCISNSLYTIGVKVGDPVVGAAWNASTPVWITVYASFLGWESLTPTKCVGIFCAFAGACVVLFVGTDLSSGSNDAVGNIFFLLNTNGLCLYGLVCRWLLRYYRPLTIAACCFFINTIYLALFTQLVGENQHLHSQMFVHVALQLNKHYWRLSSFRTVCVCVCVCVCVLQQNTCLQFII
jgi:drug/metabolite transporter (DMT)-like permease